MILRPQKIDQTGYLAFQNRDFWCVASQNLTGNFNVNCNLNTSHNLTFTGDRVV